jgi:hypothetical protein
LNKKSSKVYANCLHDRIQDQTINTLKYRNNILMGSSVATDTLMKYDSDNKTTKYVRSGHKTSAPTEYKPKRECAAEQAHKEISHKNVSESTKSFVLQENSRNYYEGRDIHN